MGLRRFGETVEASGEERFLSSQADHFTGVKWKEKTAACFVRNDSLGGVGGRSEELGNREVAWLDGVVGAAAL